MPDLLRGRLGLLQEDDGLAPVRTGGAGSSRTENGFVAGLTTTAQDGDGRGLTRGAALA